MTRRDETRAAAEDAIREFCQPADAETDHAATAILALFFAMIVGISRRRTSTVATVALSIYLSRVHAAGTERRINEETIATDHAFEAADATMRSLVAETETRLDDLRDRVETIARVTANQDARLAVLDDCFGGDPVEWLRAARDRPPNADDDCGAGGA